MDGNKTGKALGIKLFKLGGTEYDTKVRLGMIREYIKTIKNLGLRINHAQSKGLIDDVVKYSDDILDYKVSIIKEALNLGGMEKPKADELLDLHYTDVIKEGMIEMWLDLITEKDLKKDKEVKN